MPLPSARTRMKSSISSARLTRRPNMSLTLSKFVGSGRLPVWCLSKCPGRASRMGRTFSSVRPRVGAGGGEQDERRAGSEGGGDYLVRPDGGGRRGGPELLLRGG